MSLVETTLLALDIATWELWLMVASFTSEGSTGREGSTSTIITRGTAFTRGTASWTGGREDDYSICFEGPLSTFLLFRLASATTTSPDWANFLNFPLFNFIVFVPTYTQSKHYIYIYIYIYIYFWGHSHFLLAHNNALTAVLGSGPKEKEVRRSGSIKIL